MYSSSGSSWTQRSPSLSSSPDQYSSERILSSPSPSSPIYPFPHIHSSPNSPALHQDDYHLSWHPPIDTKVTYSLPSFRSLFASDDEHPLTSEYDASEYSEPDPAQDDAFLTESEDDEQDSFFSDARITFNISAERGRWKNDPFPRHALLRMTARTTSPAPSPGSSVVQRNISEPAPSIKSPPEVLPSPQASYPPVPAHASPVLSPISLSVSPMIGSVSPLSALEPLSPLSLPPSSLAGDHDMDMDMNLESFPDNDEIHIHAEPETGLGLFASPVPLSASSPSSSSPRAAIIEPPASIEADDHVAPNSAIAKKKAVSKSKSRHDSESEPRPGPSVIATESILRVKKDRSTAEKRQQQQEGNKGKKRTTQQPLKEAPKSKKARIAQPETQTSESRSQQPSRSKRVGQKVDTKTKTKSKKAIHPDARNPPLTGQNAQQRKGRPRSPSASSSCASSGPHEELTHKHVPEMDPELCGMLIECMATSRASSLPMSTLFKAVMQSYPSLQSRGTERDCLELMERVLESGTVTGGGSGMFGKVERKNKGDSDLSFEAQWFYVPERDQDQDRAQLIISMMPRPAKRSETKKYKQYYYQPLEKISRWDPEDAL
ncbi:hypothetical protein GGX14DRAFT_420720 [Mycena pura]|uniref:Uncharacterized protein n=1 Tax=Mycena pura TaxID=153505 RepID=A0AAD7E3C4_9AGAR|nr:hypothetical protein GGX14DRAFT_420720 [Mycena pura]